MTAVELFALPADDRIDRRLVRGRRSEWPSPFRSPGHAAAVANLGMVFGNWKQELWAAGHRTYGFGCPYRLERDPDTLLAYDLSVVRRELTADLAPDAPFVEGRPTLAIEVVDRVDMFDAVCELLNATREAGVGVIWLVDVFAEYVQVYRPDGRQMYYPGSAIELGPEFPGLTCPVAELFW